MISDKVGGLSLLAKFFVFVKIKSDKFLSYFIMPDRVKNSFWLAATVALFAASYAAVSYVGSYAKSIEPSTFRSFAVSGEGKAVAVPDVAQFIFSVITQGGKNVADLQKENTEKVNKVIDFMKKNGVDSKDIKTEGYSLEPRYQYFNCAGEGRACPPPEIVGYTVTQTVSVKARDFNKTGDLLSGAVGSGANSVSSLNFTVDDPTSLQNQAREEAIKKAKEKARDIARAGGFRVGRLLSIDEGGFPPPIPFGRFESLALDKGGSGGAEPLPAPTVEPGSQEVRITVTLRYEIE